MIKFINTDEINALIMANTEAMLRAIEKTPESIVRCKDCAYYEQHSDPTYRWGYGYCGLGFAEGKIYDDDYCSRADRRKSK